MKKILIIQQKMIGDVLTSSILCEALKERFSSCEIHYLINTNTIPVIAENPFIDHLKIYTPAIEKSRALKKAFRKELKIEQYDIVIDVYSKIASARMARATRAQKIIGYKKWYTKQAYTDVYSYHFHPETEAGLAIENRMKLLQAIDTNFEKQLKPKIYLTNNEIKKAEEELKLHHIEKKVPLYMIAVLGSSQDKSYPLPYLAKILDHIIDTTNAQLLLNYIPNQRKFVNELLDLCSTKTRDRIIDQLYGKSLREFIALTSLCDALIGNEGGAVNMAKALEIPTFAIFAPWIRKEAWALYENDQNVAIHLSDYKNTLYHNRKPKELKKDVAFYYDQLEPSLFLKNLDSFLNKF